MQYNTFNNVYSFYPVLCNFVIMGLNSRPVTSVFTCIKHEKSKIPFSYMLCLFCKKAYRGTKPEESFG